ncbi:MAG: DNA primase [Myxococcales bacterium]|nr:DNA primase [Myxococcales bacterium]
MIPEETISEIRERIDMVALVGEHVRLVKKGSNHVGLCPFHAEKSPSFNVSAGNKFFHCFGCQESGDPFSFTMRIEGITFPQAVRQLAERTGVEIPESDRREDAAEARKRQRAQELGAIMEEACRFYELQLKEHPAASVAREELERRGVSPEIANLFRLGYAPHTWDALLSHLRQKGIPERDADEVGLLGRRRDDSGFYDRFRGRLMFPLRELGGAVVAFSGRVLPPPSGELKGDEPKYVNSPEGPLYHKGQVLYGLHEGRVETRRRDWAILCEGNFDLLALHQSGLSNSMAPLGTAFTAAQAKLLARFAKRVTLLFDGDAAGLKAVRAAQPMLAEFGLRGQVAQLPSGDDPDSFLRRHGADGLRELVGQARGIVEFLIDAAADQAGPSAAERAAAVEELGPVLATVRNSVEVQLYIDRVSQRFGLTDQRALRQQLRQGVLRGRRRPGDKPVKSQVDPRPEGVKLPRLQKELLGVLLDRPKLFATPEAGQLEELLTSAALRDVFRAARAAAQENGVLDVPALLSALENHEALPWLRESLALQTYRGRDDADQVLKNGIPLLAKSNREQKLRGLSREISAARQSGNNDLADSLMRQRELLVRGG